MLRPLSRVESAGILADYHATLLGVAVADARRYRAAPPAEVRVEPAAPVEPVVLVRASGQVSRGRPRQRAR